MRLLSMKEWRKELTDGIEEIRHETDVKTCFMFLIQATLNK